MKINKLTKTDSLNKKIIKALIDEKIKLNQKNLKMVKRLHDF